MQFNEEQIIGILKEVGAGLKRAELRSRYSISEATCYNWTVKFCGMTASDALHLKEPGQEN